MTDIELLPCPFCGGTSTLTDKDSPICPVGHILCDDCYASADSARWNHRATAAKAAEIEALRAEVERLQEIVRPKREEECLTLDHWRMRAYDLEANWSRCSRACATIQTERDTAKARAEQLAEALRDAAEALQVAGLPGNAKLFRSMLRDKEVGNG